MRERFTNSEGSITAAQSTRCNRKHQAKSKAPKQAPAQKWSHHTALAKASKERLVKENTRNATHTTGQHHQEPKVDTKNDYHWQSPKPRTHPVSQHSLPACWCQHCRPQAQVRNGVMCLCSLVTSFRRLGQGANEVQNTLHHSVACAHVFRTENQIVIAPAESGACNDQNHR
jgi:hypothetical protein